MSRKNSKPRSKRPEIDRSPETRKEEPEKASDVSEETGYDASIPEIISEVETGLAPDEEDAGEALAPIIELAPDDDPVPAPSTEKGLVGYDPLNAYLSEIRRIPPMTREQEHETALHYHKHQDPESAYKLVSSNLWLVVKVARDYERVAKSLLDLIQEGNIGLMEAVKNYDPFRGVRFPSYAVWWIKAYMIRFVISNWRLVKIGTTQAQRKLFFNLKKETEKLERQGVFPGAKLLAEKLKVRESDIVEMEQRMSSPDVSVDAPLQSDADSTLHALLPAAGPTAEQIVGQRELWSQMSVALEEYLETLKPKERTVFEDRLLRDEKLTLQEVSDKLSISRERVRQIENRLKEKFRLFLMERAGLSSQEFELD